MHKQYDTSHGSPYDRGSADAYYGRRFNPHRYVGTERVAIEKGTEDWQAYHAGYVEEDGQKDYGAPE